MRKRNFSAPSYARAAETKKRLLGMSVGTANAILIRELLYQLVCEAGRNTCHRCQLPILTVKELSIEHKDSWQRAHDPIQSFFDLSNVSFSHRKCNYSAAHKPNKKFYSKEEKLAYYRPIDAARARATYTPEKRRKKFLTTGH